MFKSIFVKGVRASLSLGFPHIIIPLENERLSNNMLELHIAFRVLVEHRILAYEYVLDDIGVRDP